MEWRIQHEAEKAMDPRNKLANLQSDTQKRSSPIIE